MELEDMDIQFSIDVEDWDTFVNIAHNVGAVFNAAILASNTRYEVGMDYDDFRNGLDNSICVETLGGKT